MLHKQWVARPVSRTVSPPYETPPHWKKILKVGVCNGFYFFYLMFLCFCKRGRWVPARDRNLPVGQLKRKGSTTLAVPVQRRMHPQPPPTMMAPLLSVNEYGGGTTEVSGHHHERTEGLRVGPIRLSPRNRHPCWKATCLPLTILCNLVLTTTIFTILLLVMLWLSAAGMHVSDFIHRLSLILRLIYKYGCVESNDIPADICDALQ